MFPVGALVGAALASRNAAQPSQTRAGLVHGKWVLQPPDGLRPVFSVLVFALGVLGCLAIGENGGLGGWAIFTGCGALLLPVVGLFNGTYFVFDETEIELISPWRRGVRKIAWRELEVMRQAGAVLVLRDAKFDVKLKVPVTWAGFATLADVVLRNRPKDAQCDMNTEMLLTRLAKVVGG